MEAVEANQSGQDEVSGSGGGLSGDQALTPAERDRMESNRKRALELHRARVVKNDGNPYTAQKPNLTFSRPTDSGGGFFIESAPASTLSSTRNPRFEKSEEETDAGSSDDGIGVRRPRKRRRRLRVIRSSAVSSLTSSSSQSVGIAAKDLAVPLPPDEEKPICDECSRPFDQSFLLQNFNCSVCDGCRDPKGIHTLITRTTAKERYLLSDVDLDVREPPLQRILKRNPRNTIWGDMQLYLEAQVAARSLELWVSEEKLEEERERRAANREKTKMRGFEKKVKELRLQVRSSLYSKKSVTHEHTFGPDEYDEATDTYCKTCSSCNYSVKFEKM